MSLALDRAVSLYRESRLRSGASGLHTHGASAALVPEPVFSLSWMVIRALPSVLPATGPASTNVSKISFKDTHLLMSFPHLKPFSGATLRIKSQLICMVNWAPASPLLAVSPASFLSLSLHISAMLPSHCFPHLSCWYLSVAALMVPCIQLIFPHLAACGIANSNMTSLGGLQDSTNRVCCSIFCILWIWHTTVTTSVDSRVRLLAFKSVAFPRV